MPGSDGLLTKFYLAFWSDLEEPLLAVLNGCYNVGSLADSQRESLLLLI